MLTPRRRDARTRTRPTGSPIASAAGSTSMFAPIATSASSAPERVGLRPTFSTVTSLPATVAAATNRNVADDRSPGMTIGIARSFPFQPSGVDGDRAAAGVDADRRAHGPQHAFRVIAGAARLAQRAPPLGLQPREHQRALELRARDRKVVADARQRAAAHAHRREDVAGFRRHPRARRCSRPSGAAARPRAASAAASATRLRTSSVSNGRPARRPMSNRMVVPELPQSSAPAAACSPAKPTPSNAGLVAGQRDVDAQRAQRRRRRQVVAAPARARAPRPGRPRARRTAAPGARSTCRPGRGRCRAAGRIGGPSAWAPRPVIGCSLPHRRARSSRSLPVLRQRLQHRQQLLRQALARSARMWRRTWTREPSAVSDRPSNTGARPSSITIGWRAVRARGVAPDRGRRGRVPAAVEHRQRRRDPGRCRGSGARRSATGPSGIASTPAARARMPSVTVTAKVTAGGFLSASSARRSAPSRPAPASGTTPQAASIAARTRWRPRARSFAGVTSATAPPLRLPQRAAAATRSSRRRGRRAEGAADPRGVEATARDRQRAFGPPVTSVPATSIRSASVNTS